MPAKRGEVGEMGIKGFLESSLLDWPGKVASVVFLPGCNFRCPFCHNHALVLRPETIDDVPFDAVLASLKAHRGWVDGVVVTGGEPTLYPGLDGLLIRLKEAGMPVRLDTNGSDPYALERLIGQGLITAVAMDIKAPLTYEAYGRAAGVSVNMSRIRDSIRLLLNSPVEVAFRATVVPGLHDEAAVREMAGAVDGALALQNFRPDDAMEPAYRKIRPFSPEEFNRLCTACKG